MGSPRRQCGVKVACASVTSPLPYSDLYPSPDNWLRVRQGNVPPAVWSMGYKAKPLPECLISMFATPTSTLCAAAEVSPTRAPFFHIPVLLRSFISLQASGECIPHIL